MLYSGHSLTPTMSWRRPGVVTPSNRLLHGPRNAPLLHPSKRVGDAAGPTALEHIPAGQISGSERLLLV